jgi:hypothetical protein
MYCYILYACAETDLTLYFIAQNLFVNKHRSITKAVIQISQANPTLVRTDLARACCLIDTTLFMKT